MLKYIGTIEQKPKENPLSSYRNLRGLILILLHLQIPLYTNEKTKVYTCKINFCCKTVLKIVLVLALNSIYLPNIYLCDFVWVKSRKIASLYVQPKSIYMQMSHEFELYCSFICFSCLPLV